MLKLSDYQKFDLRPWLIARAAKVSVIIPFNDSTSALNDQIAALHSQFLPNLHAILLVDSDCALDSRAVRELSNRYGDRLHLIENDPQDSPGIALMEGFSYALDSGSRNIIQLSLGNMDYIDVLPDMLRFADQYDLVIGSRFLEPQEFICPQKQAQYKIDRWIHGHLLKNLFGGKITDGTSGVRCWSRVSLEFILTRLRLRSPSLLNFEMAYLAYKNNLKMLEIPITYLPTVMKSPAIPNNSPYHS